MQEVTNLSRLEIIRIIKTCYPKSLVLYAYLKMHNGETRFFCLEYQAKPERLCLKKSNGHKGKLSFKGIQKMFILSHLEVVRQICGLRSTLEEIKRVNKKSSDTYFGIRSYVESALYLV